jgi:hypothetical protein
MDYELNLAGAATAASPLTSGMFTSQTTLAQYTAAVPASKVILGTPFFGIDWPTNNGTMAATSTGGAADIADAQAQANGPQYWDPVTHTAWTSYQVGGQWHESHFDSAYALYQVAQLAARYGVRGVGIWALGMEDDGPQLIAALDGLAPAGGPGGSGPGATSSSPAAVPPAPASTTTPAAPITTTTKPPGAATSTTTTKAPGPTTTTAPVTTATYNGKTVTLAPVAPGGADMLLGSGTVTNFQSTDPRFSCLDGKSLAVYQFGLLSGKVVAVPAAGSCTAENFTFA